MDVGLLWIFTRRLLLVLTATLCAAASPALAYHDPFGSNAGLQLPLTACVKPVAAGDRAEVLLARPDLLDCQRHQIDFGPGDYWVRLAVPDNVAANATMLRWTSMWQDSAAITIAYADGARATLAVPSTVSGRYVHIGAYYTVALEQAKRPQTILFRITGATNLRGILVNPNLASSDHITSVDSGRSALYGGFAGLCLALFIYNLMMWRAMRENYLAAYCAVLAACLTYALFSSAAIAQLFPGIDNNLRLRFNYLTMTVAAICAVWFARSFLGSAHFSRRFDRMLIGTGALALMTSAAVLLLAPWQMFWLDRINFMALSLFFIVGSSMLFRAAMKGGRLERLFVAAWVFPVALNVPRLLHAFGWFDQSFWLDNATLFAMTIEALLSSMIIVWRVRLMQNDRDLARAKEAAALELADTDELTGLANRRALMRAACPNLDAVGNYRLILIDIDNFKGINDSVGHIAGDAVLVKVAGVIRASLRPGVIAARTGGEEFALLFPTGHVDRRYYSSLLARVRALPPVAGQRVTISMGAANGWLGGTEGEWLALYRAADAALYEAKSNGRNRLVVAPRYRDYSAAA